jgi:hypothetical protein
VKYPPIVHVEWEDACDIDDVDTWVTVDEAPKYTPMMMQTAGYMVYDGAEGIIITHTVSKDAQAPRQQIPRGMIRKLTVLRKAK